MKSLGLIGFGQFGRLAASHLKFQFRVLVSDPAPGAEDAAREIGVALGSLEAAAGCDIVVVAVPVQAMQAVFARIAPHLKPGALVIDVGSVKLLPTQWMLEALPPHVDIVATHPLFGPQSARNGLSGLRFVVCEVRGKQSAQCVAGFARSLSLDVSFSTPEEHDRAMAYVQAISHLIGRSLDGIGAPDTDLATRSYQHLLDLRGLIGNDSFELFAAIQTFNPFARDVSEAFVAKARTLLDEAGKGPSQAG